MTVANRAVAMAVMTEARAIYVEQEAKLEPMLVESIMLDSFGVHYTETFIIAGSITVRYVPKI